ncbi:hypothetical protein IB237_18055 [Agrobacterium sp. AGB01]|jgi:hypothetical protein|uniref:hypothetical protein n=1 Tax=Agrobacterium sp. AGB01 TaxID=2769302 RepID=UPI001783B78E|nr:hypothetical protein [Agrobacterium sp. AGB01]MBD9389091.1 hypothetical protein [Agrobacterium sp. AGB01]
MDDLDIRVLIPTIRSSEWSAVPQAVRMKSMQPTRNPELSCVAVRAKEFDIRGLHQRLNISNSIQASR